MVWEEKFFGTVLVESGEDAVVGDEGFEFATERVSLDPVYHVTAVGGAEGDGAGGVDVGEVGFDVFEAFYQVGVRTATPVVLDAVLEGHSVACTTCWVGSYDDVALFGENGWIPASGPSFVPGSLWLNDLVWMQML